MGGGAAADPLLVGGLGFEVLSVDTGGDGVDEEETDEGIL